MIRLSPLPVAALLVVTALRGADDQVRRMTERLAKEAAAFQEIAPQLLGRETMQQRAQKPPRRFRIRIGEAARIPPQPEWELRTLVSEYGYATFGDGALHELRQVVSVDDKPAKSNKGPEELARIITASNEKRKLELLKSFQEFGLRGAVNDFGQIILLFSPRNIGRYEFVFQHIAIADGVSARVFDYRQIDGPNALTVADARDDDTQQVRMEGQVWLREDDDLPLRVTVASTQQRDGRTVRHEATVNYAPSEYGTLLPAAMRHRELWDDQVVTEHNVRYENFRRFAASTEIQFGPAQPSAPGRPPK